MTEADLHVWVFGMDLPSIPKFAWDAIKNDIDPVVELSRAKDAVFPVTRELWRFLVSTTLYSICIESLCRLEDSILPQEVHNARAKTQFRRATTRFRNLIYQTDIGEDELLFARVRSALADTLPCSAIHLPCERCRSIISQAFLPAFLRRWIKRKSWTGWSRIRHCPTSH